MTAADWLALAGGTAGIAWVNGYFFLARRPAVATGAATADAPQDATIAVHGGHSPAVVRVRAARCG